MAAYRAWGHTIQAAPWHNHNMQQVAMTMWYRPVTKPQQAHFPQLCSTVRTGMLGFPSTGTINYSILLFYSMPHQ